VFIALFEPKSDDTTRQARYRNAAGAFCNDDWTLAKVVAHIRTSSEFRDLSTILRAQYTAANVKKFFETNVMYKKLVHYDSETKQTTLKGWRLQVTEVEDSPEKGDE
jgi:hypothetical protein